MKVNQHGAAANLAVVVPLHGHLRERGSGNGEGFEAGRTGNFAVHQFGLLKIGREHEIVDLKFGAGVSMDPKNVEAWNV